MIDIEENAQTSQNYNLRRKRVEYENENLSQKGKQKQYYLNKQMKENKIANIITSSNRGQHLRS